MLCHSCKKDVPLTDGKVGRQEDCPHCGADLHVCLNCGFYDRSAYNECREPSAERVVDKEKSNFCDYFKPTTGAATTGGPSAADEAKRKLEELFRKK